MRTYKIDSLGASENLANKINSLVKKEERIYIEGVGQVDIGNVNIVCNTIKMIQKLSSAKKDKKVKKQYKKRTVEQDMTIVEYMKTHTIKETAKMFDLPTSTICNIRRKYNITKSKKCS